MRFEQQDKIIDSLSKATGDFIYCIVGESGAGKKYAVDQYIKNNDLNCLVLKMADRGVPIPYAPFLSAIDLETLFAIKGALEQVISDIKVIGNLKKTVQAYKSNAMFQYTEEEQSIISRVRDYIVHYEIDIIFCQDIDKWDINSKILLEKLCTFQEKSILKVPIIATSSNENCCLCRPEQIITLNNISFENFSQELLRLSGKSFDNEEMESLYAITNRGNVSLVLYVIEALQSDNILSKDKSLYDLLIKRIMDTVAPDKGNRIVEFLKQASLLGYSILKTLVIGYSELSQTEFNIFMNTLQKLKYMQENGTVVQFYSEIIYKLISSEANKDVAYKNKLAEFIRKVYPADYEYISSLYENANDTHNAAIFRAQFIIQYVRDKQILLDKKYYEINILRQYKLIDDVSLIEKAYIEYYSGSEKVLSTLSSFSCKESILEFERIYLLFLYYFNNNIQFDMTKEGIKELTTYFKSNEFKAAYLEAWLRCAMLILGMQIEIKNTDAADNTYTEIWNTFDSKMMNNTLDAKLEELYFHFLQTSATFMKKIEITKDHIKKAFSYYESVLSNTSNFSHYFNALVNYTSISLITYDYDTVERLSKRAQMMIQNNVPISEDYLTCIKNNYAISKILQTKYDKAELNSAQKMFEELIKNNTNIISNVLLKINLCNIYFLLGKPQWHLIEELFNSVNCETEEYYKYYIYNNYAMMLYFDGQVEPATAIFDEIKNITPNVQDKIYFNLRNKYIAEMLQKEQKTTNFVNEIDISNPPGVGWSFWGKYLLFSELEEWSF